MCSDLFVFPSRYEAFSLATLEAAACGHALYAPPVIATRINGTEDLDTTWCKWRIYCAGARTDRIGATQRLWQIQIAVAKWVLKLVGSCSNVSTHGIAIARMTEESLQRCSLCRSGKKDAA